MSVMGGVCCFPAGDRLKPAPYGPYMTRWAKPLLGIQVFRMPAWVFSGLLLEYVDQDDVGVFLQAAEDDFLSVRGNIEVTDQEFTAEVGQLTLLPGHNVDQPEVFVPDVPFQH